MPVDMSWSDGDGKTLNLNDDDGKTLNLTESLMFIFDVDGKTLNQPNLCC